MIRGLYTAASGMLSTLLANDTLASNLANSDTVGFKKNRVSFQSFPDLMLQKSTIGGAENIGSISSGSRIKETKIDFLQGSLYNTGNSFDMALEGPGFFTIQSKTDPNKTFYTRSGHFTINPDGFLTTVTGDYVMGNLGKIQTKQDPPPYVINDYGDLTSYPNGNTSQPARVVDRMKITRFENDEYLMKASDTMFEQTPYTKELPEPGTHEGTPYKIHQGMLEHSNTNVVSELVNSISGMRLYEALQKNIHMQNETVGKAVNELGRYK